MNTNTNNITLNDFNGSLAMIISNIAGSYNPSQIISFSYEALRIMIINRAKNMDLVVEDHIGDFENLILNLSDDKMNSLRNALCEYSSVINNL